MTVRIVEGELTTLGSVSGTDGTPIGINAEANRAQRFYIENPIAVIQTATGIANFVGAGTVVVTQETNTIIVSGTPHVAGGGSIDLQSAYDAGATIQNTTGKPVVITEFGNEEAFRVVGSGTFTEALTVGTGSTHLNSSSVTTASGVFEEHLTVSGVPVNIGAGGVTDHGSLTGLANDDHTQYHNDARGDIRYYTQTQLTSTASGSPGAGLVGFPTVSGVDIPATLEASSTFFNSAGCFSGGVISDAGGLSVDISSGLGSVRTSASPLSQLVAFGWDSVSGVPIPSETVRYFGIRYNPDNDTASIITKTIPNDWNTFTEFGLGFVANRNSQLHIINTPYAVGDSANLVNQRFDSTGITRDEAEGGLILGETGTRNITMSAGALWKRLNKFPITSVDTSASDDFESFYRDGVGGFTLISGVTQWDNINYDDGTGTLNALGNNRWGVLWFYMALDEDLSCVYGRQEHNSQSSAENESPPNTLPVGFPNEMILIARLIFQEGAATAGAIQSAFDTTYSNLGVTNHSDLSNLTADDHTQYSLVDGTRSFTGAVGGVTPSSSSDLATKGYVDTTSGSLQSQIDSISLQDAYNNGDGIITTAGDKPFQITGSGVVQGDLSVSGTYQGLPKSIIIENPNGVENLSFFFTPTSETISRIIPTTSGESPDAGITWSLRFDSDRGNHTGASEVITGGSNTHDGNSGTGITTFSNPLISANSHIWVETTSVSGTMAELALTVLF